MATFTIISDTHTTKASLKNLFEFLSDFKNFNSILPEDKVENFEYLGDQCSFNIKGITAMTIKLVEKEAFQRIVFNSVGLAKFNFTLTTIFIGESNQAGQCRVELQGDLNPFIKAMAEKPLGNLVNVMSQKLSQINLL